jgi:hypothetical protein
MRVNPEARIPFAKVGSRVGAGTAVALFALMAGLMIAELFLSIMRAHF